MIASHNPCNSACWTRILRRIPRSILASAHTRAFFGGNSPKPCRIPRGVWEHEANRCRLIAAKLQSLGHQTGEQGDGSAFLHSNGTLTREDELTGANKGTEVRSRIQARRSLPAARASRVAPLPAALALCGVHSAFTPFQSPLARIAPFGGGDAGCLLERLRERRRSWPTQARGHVRNRIAACEQDLCVFDSARLRVSPDALPRLARERRA